jgi:integrase/recombinase XerD
MNASQVQRHNAALVTEYLTWQRDRRNRSPQTIYVYTDTLDKFLRWIGGTPLAVVGLGTMESFVDRPRIRRRPTHPTNGPTMGAPATRKRDVTVLRSMYRYLHERGHLGSNPAALLIGPTVHNTNPKAIDDGLWAAFWQHPDLSHEERAAFGLGYFVGLRRYEIMHLRPEHISAENGQLRGFVRKGGSEDSISYTSAVRLIAAALPSVVPGGPDSFLSAIDEVLADRARDQVVRFITWNGIWASEPMHYFNRRLQRALRRCGLPTDSFTPHALRHSFVSNLLRAGVPLHEVSRLANHTSVETTMRYVKTSTDPLADRLAAIQGAPTLLDRPHRYG